MRQRIVAGEPKNDAPEQRHQQTVVNDGVGNVGAQPQQKECAPKPNYSDPEAQMSGARNQLIQFGQQNAEHEAGQMRQRRKLERLQPGTGAEAIGMGNAVGIEDDIERARNEPNHPDYAETSQNWPHPPRLLPPRQPGK